jgi:hypothetical protein
MRQLLDILQSGTFWTAVGSIAAVCAVVVALLQRRKKKRLSRSERQRVIGQAKEAASRCDYWMKNYIHHGKKTDTQKLIEWLESDRGYAQVADDYQVFLKTTELLKEQGYNIPPHQQKPGLSLPVEGDWRENLEHRFSAIIGG